MTIQFRCKCGQKLSAPEDWGGRPTTCPKCKSSILIPGPTEVSPPLSGTRPVPQDGPPPVPKPIVLQPAKVTTLSPPPPPITAPAFNARRLMVPIVGTMAVVLVLSIVGTLAKRGGDSSKSAATTREGRPPRDGGQPVASQGSVAPPEPVASPALVPSSSISPSSNSQGSSGRQPPSGRQQPSRGRGKERESAAEQQKPPSLQADVKKSIETLSSDNSTAVEKREAIEDLRSWRKMAIPAIPVLAKYLDSHEFCEAAARTLAALGPPAVEPLAGHLKGDQPGDVFVCRALGDLGDPAAVAPLARALRIKGGPAQEAAAGALVRIGPPALDSLIEIVLEPDGPTAVLAVRAIAQMAGAQSPQRTRIAAAGSGDTEATEATKTSIEPLIAALEHKEWEVRIEVAATLGAFRAGSAVAPLLKALQLHEETKGADPQKFRAAATKAVKDILGEADAKPALMKTLRLGPSWHQHTLAVPEKGPWANAPMGVRDIAADKEHRCVWYLAGDSSLGRLDLNSDRTTRVADDTVHGRCLVVGKDRVWLGGALKMESNLQLLGGGLAMYDVPSESLVTFTAENTTEENVSGLRSNAIHALACEGDTVWVACNGCELVRLRYREKQHEKRWRVYTIPNATPTPMFVPGATVIKNVLVYGDKLLLPYGGRLYLFDPTRGQFSRLDVFGAKTSITGLTPRGKQVTIAERSRDAGINVLTVEGKKIWFTDFFVWNNYDFPALVCYDPEEHRSEVFASGLSESRPDAGDGMSVPSVALVDGDDVWMALSQAVLVHSAAIFRYSRSRREFTHYTAETESEISRNAVFWRIAATDDSVFFAAGQKFLRFFKSERYPKVLETSPPDGANDLDDVKELTVALDIPMNPKTINANTVQLLANGAVLQGRVKYDPENRRVVFQLHRRLPSSTNYELVLKSLIQAENGNPIRSTRVAFSTK